MTDQTERQLTRDLQDRLKRERARTERVRDVVERVKRREMTPERGIDQIAEAIARRDG